MASRTRAEIRKAERDRKRKQAQTRRTFEPGAGDRVVPHYESAATDCGCKTHGAFGIPCTSVAWRTIEPRADRPRRYRLRCLACGRVWWREVLRGRGLSLDLDASHPEERAARARRNAERVRVPLNSSSGAYQQALGIARRRQAART